MEGRKDAEWNMRHGRVRRTEKMRNGRAENVENAGKLHYAISTNYSHTCIHTFHTYAALERLEGKGVELESCCITFCAYRTYVRMDYSDYITVI